MEGGGNSSDVPSTHAAFSVYNHVSPDSFFPRAAVFLQVAASFPYGPNPCDLFSAVNRMLERVLSTQIVVVLVAAVSVIL